MAARAARKRPVEYSILYTATLCLLAFGAVMVYSASSAESLLSGPGDPSYYLKRYLLCGLLGLVVMHLASRHGLRIVKALTPFLLIGSFGLTIAVMLPGLGVTINEIYGQTEANYVVGNCASVWDVRPGSMGRPFPGHEIALLDESTPVVCVATDSPILDKVVSNIQEVRARGAHVIAVASEGNKGIAHHADEVIPVPALDWMLQPLLAECCTDESLHREVMELYTLAGRRHELWTAAIVLRDDARLWHEIAAARLKEAEEALDLALAGPRKDQVEAARAAVAAAHVLARAAAERGAPLHRRAGVVEGLHLERDRGRLVEHLQLHARRGRHDARHDPHHHRDLGARLADLLCLLVAGHRAQRRERLRCGLGRDEGHEDALVRHVHRVDAEDLAGPGDGGEDRHAGLPHEQRDARRPRQLVQRRRDASARGVAEAAQRRAARLEQRVDRRPERARVRLDGRLQLELAAREHHRGAVLSDAAGDEDPVARPDRRRRPIGGRGGGVCA